jgi:hypothetical protein
MPKLKVFCTTSGFYDHVVAAPSRPAALKAWGARTDLFSMGVARQVDDPKIREKALERPGEVIRLKRAGSKAEAVPMKRKQKAARKPSRAKLSAAEKRLADLDAKQAEELEKITSEIKALERMRTSLEKRQAKARNAAEVKVQELRKRYEAALEG